MQTRPESTAKDKVSNIEKMDRCFSYLFFCGLKSVQERSGRVLDSRPRGRRFQPYQRHCVVSLSKKINPSLVLVQPWKTRSYVTERLLMGR